MAAIQSIAKSFKLRLRSKRKATDSAAETTVSGGGEITTLKSTTKEDEFRQVFQFFDTNNDGRISPEELRAYLTSVGESVSNEAAERIIGEFSKSRGEDQLSLELGEFVRMMEMRDGEDDDDEVLRQAFEVYEVEKGSGEITAEGLRQVLRRLGDVKTCKECEAMIRVFDLDGNGVLDFHEFQKMMT